MSSLSVIANAESKKQEVLITMLITVDSGGQVGEGHLTSYGCSRSIGRTPTRRLPMKRLAIANLVLVLSAPVAAVPIFEVGPESLVVVPNQPNSAHHAPTAH